MSIPKGVCSFDDCEKHVRQLGLCSGHYSQLKRGTELKPLRPRFRSLTPCTFDGCDRPRQSNGLLCRAHAKQHSKGKELVPIRARRLPHDPAEPCSFAGCRHSSRGHHGLCSGHIQQKRRGEELRPLRERNRKRNSVCTLDGCDKPHQAKGLCSYHYKRSIAGLPLVPAPKPLALQIAQGVRTCSGKDGCGKTLPLDQFYANGPDAYQSICVPCWRDRRIRTAYGLTPEAWQELFDKQGRCCAICRSAEPNGRTGWATDHDHTCCPTGNTCGKCVRGILCQRCNKTVGHIEAHPNIAAALNYINSYAGVGQSIEVPA